MTAVTTTITSTVVSTREYDIANRLITVTTDGQVRTLEWSDAGELLRDGNDTYHGTPQVGWSVPRWTGYRTATHTWAMVVEYR